MSLRRIGTWISSLKDERRPAPQELVATIDPALRECVADYLDSAPIVSHNQVFGAGRCVADCLFKDCLFSTGIADCSDGTWIWTQDLGHYFRHHDVRLPNEFTDSVLAVGDSPREWGVCDATKEDEGFWLAWCAGNRSVEFLEALRIARRNAKDVLTAELEAHVAWLIEDGERRLGVSSTRCQWHDCERVALQQRAFCGLHLAPWPIRLLREYEIYAVQPLLDSFFISGTTQ